MNRFGDLHEYRHRLALSPTADPVRTGLLCDRHRLLGLAGNRFPVAIGLWLANLYFTPKLALALNKSGLVWFVMAIVGPVILWIPQLLLLNAANKLFRAEGLKIGFLGGAKAP